MKHKDPPTCDQGDPITQGGDPLILLCRNSCGVSTIVLSACVTGTKSTQDFSELSSSFPGTCRNQKREITPKC